MAEITFEDWKQLKLKVGVVVEAERVPKTAKLYKLQVEIGQVRPVQIITSLVPYYSAEQLLGRRSSCSATSDRPPSPARCPKPCCSARKRRTPASACY